MVIYSIEAGLKLIFYGRYYFQDGWNIFDFGIVILWIVLLFIESFMSIGEGPQSFIITCVKVAKLFSLFKLTSILRKMFQTFILALPAVGNLALLFLVVLSIFAVIGVFLLSPIKLQVDLNEHANFQNLLVAILTVLRLATADLWTGIMHDAMRGETQYFHCVDYPTYSDILANGGEANGCGVVFAPVYFVLLQLIVTFVFLNLFIAIVVSSTQDIVKLSESVLSDEKLKKFQDIWRKFDPEVNISLFNYIVCRQMDLSNIITCPNFFKN